MGYTNEAVQVIVRVPKTYTNITVTTNNASVVIGSQSENNNMYEYLVNETNIEDNYIVTVTYEISGSELTSTYEVNSFDNAAPVITIQKPGNGTALVSVTDNSNKIKFFKYTEGEILQANVLSYFTNNGKIVVNEKMTLDLSIDKYTIFAEDYAGNYSYIVLNTIEPGDYIEYDVGYKDVYKTANVYESTNGWRLVQASSNGDGTYSNVIIMSTGIPAKLNYSNNDSTTNKDDWWETDTTKLNAFKTILTNDYNLYNNGDITVPSIKAAAGLYYNFENVKFSYGTSASTSKGIFTSIITDGTTYDSTHNTGEQTGGTLFNLFGTNAKVRLLTLPEVNTAVGRSDIDSTTQISTSDNSNGLYRLDQLTAAQTGITGFATYDSGYYWLPYPGFSYDLVIVAYDGSVNAYSSYTYGVRPAVSLTSNIRFVDEDSNGIPEIQIVN